MGEGVGYDRMEGWRGREWRGKGGGGVGVRSGRVDEWMSWREVDGWMGVSMQWIDRVEVGKLI